MKHFYSCNFYRIRASVTMAVGSPAKKKEVKKIIKYTKRNNISYVEIFIFSLSGQREFL